MKLLYTLIILLLSCSTEPEDIIYNTPSEVTINYIGLPLSNTPILFQDTLINNGLNKSRPSTSINFEIAEESYVSISIFNSQGVEVILLVDDILTAGSYSITWNANGFSTGIYIIRMEAGEYSASQKLILIK